MTCAFKGKKIVECRGFGLSCSGMTLLEVLIAILLFAVFTGTFLMVTEMIGQLFPAEQVPAAENGCNGPALEEACINSAFDRIIPYLERYVEPGETPGAVVDTIKLGQIAFDEISDLKLLPDSYEIEVHQWDEKFEAQQANENMPAMPGLYLLQAKPKTDSTAFWRKPIQRLFCRPYYRCLEP